MNDAERAHTDCPTTAPDRLRANPSPQCNFPLPPTRHISPPHRISVCMAHTHGAAHPSAPPAHVSTPVTPSDKLVASVISLPSNSRIAYVTFVSATDGPPYDPLEFGRRQLVSRNDSLTLLESILPHAHIDGTSSALHAFMFTSLDHSDPCLSALRAISLDGLVGKRFPDP